MVLVAKSKLGLKRTLGRVTLGRRHFFFGAGQRGGHGGAAAATAATAAAAAATAAASRTGLDHWHDMEHRPGVAIERWHDLL